MIINTDTRTISDTTLAKEYGLLESVFEWDKACFKRCNLEGIKHSIAPLLVKERIRKQIEGEGNRQRWRLILSG